MKVLSRKPTAKTAGATRNGSAQPDYDDGEDENDAAMTPLTIEEHAPAWRTSFDKLDKCV